MHEVRVRITAQERVRAIRPNGHARGTKSAEGAVARALDGLVERARDVVRGGSCLGCEGWIISSACACTLSGQAISVTVIQVALRAAALEEP